MLAKQMFEFRNYLHEEGIMFCYSGYMTEDILSGIGDAIKKKLALDSADKATVRGVFSIFVEQMQNVIRYSAERESHDEQNELSFGVLTVGKDNGHFFVSCGNAVENKDAKRLKEQLALIQGLDKDGLKTLYKETLRGETPEGSKGAGVGFIDIARRSNHGFDYDFVETQGDRAFFTMKAYI